MAEKSVQKLLDGVEASKKVPFERVLFALGIRYVGETVAKKLAKALGSMGAIMEASQEQLEEVDEIGERIAVSLIEYFSLEDNRALVKRLSDSGLQMEAEEIEGATDKLAGKSIVVSGVFEILDRDGVKKLIEQHGGKVGSSISKKTAFIVAGDKWGQARRRLKSLSCYNI